MKKYDKNERYLNFVLRESTFLKKSAIGKPIEELTPKDFKKWVKNFWWNKTSGMNISQDHKMLKMDKQEHIWHCLYNKEGIK